MTDPTAPAATAATTAVVIGGGVSGLLSARELARTGHDVTLLEATGTLGGAVAPHRVVLPDGQELALDAGAESFAVRTPAVRGLVDELGLGDAVVAPNPAGSWLFLPPAGPAAGTRDTGSGGGAGTVGPGRAVRSPRVGILGIPGDLAAPEVADALGPEALERARQDLTAPVDHWRAVLHDGGPVTVGGLVRDRLGAGVLETLVAPVIAGVHSADPDTLDARTAAPGLLEALVAEGSLARAVSARRAAAPPGALVASLRGGMNTLTGALAEGLRRAGARMLTGARATGLERSGTGWAVSVSGGPGASGREAGPDTGSTAGRDAVEVLRADRVVVATDGPTAWDLFAPVSGGALSPAERPAEGAGVALVTLVVDEAGLDAGPRGTGLLVSPTVDAGTVGAKAMTHVTAKWDWAREAATGVGTVPGGEPTAGSATVPGPRHPHRHVLRLSYGRVSDAPDSPVPGYRTPDEELKRLAVADASTLTGVDLTGAVVASSVVRWRAALPAATTEHRRRVEAVRTWLQGEPGLEAVGAWQAGTGLAAVVADVRRRIE